MWIVSLQDLKSSMKIKEKSFPLVWGQMKKYGYEGQVRGTALTGLSLNSVEMNKDVQFPPAAACLLYTRKRRET